MQSPTAQPRQGFTSGEVLNALAFTHGGVIRGGVEIRDAAGVPRGAVILNESTQEDWYAGILSPGLTVTPQGVTS